MKAGAVVESGPMNQSRLKCRQIVFFVVAAAAPLTAMLGAVPPAISLGNGPGLPGAYVIVGIILLLFSVGFAAMSRHVINAGAFYAYIAQGLGRPFGVGAAFRRGRILFGDTDCALWAIWFLLRRHHWHAARAFGLLVCLQLRRDCWWCNCSGSATRRPTAAWSEP